MKRILHRMAEMENFKHYIPSISYYIGFRYNLASGKGVEYYLRCENLNVLREQKEETENIRGELRILRFNGWFINFTSERA